MIETFKLVPDERVLEELDEVDLALQNEMLAEQERRRAEERKILALEKEKEERARQRASGTSFNFHQSFMGAPHSN